MHDEVSETENIRKNLSIERQIVEGCDMLLDVNQIFIRQGTTTFNFPFVVMINNLVLMCRYYTYHQFVLLVWYCCYDFQHFVLHIYNGDNRPICFFFSYFLRKFDSDYRES